MAEKKRNIRILSEIDLEHFDADNILRIVNFAALPEDIQISLKQSSKVISSEFELEEKVFISAQNLAKLCSKEKGSFQLMFDAKTIGLVDAINYSIYYPSYERDEPHNAKLKHTIIGHKDNYLIKADSVTFKSNGTNLYEKDFQTFLGYLLNVESSQVGKGSVFTVTLKNQENIHENTLPQLVLMLFGAVIFDPKEFKALDSITMHESRFSYRGNGKEQIHLPFGR